MYSTGKSFVTGSLNNISDPLTSIGNTLGDYNGDGHLEMIYKYGSNSYQALISFLPDKDIHKVGSITDGFKNTIQINYKTLPILATQNQYTKGIGATYPVIDFQKAMTVVSYITNDACTHNSDIAAMSYSYEGAKIHLQGKSFLGFTKVTTTDLDRKFVIENAYETGMTWLTGHFLQHVLTSSKTSVLGGQGINEKTFPSYTFISGINLPMPDNSGKRYQYYTHQTIDNDQLHGNITTTTLQQDGYGNITNMGSNNTVGTNYSSSGFEQKGAWIPSRPYGQIKTTSTKTGEPAYSRSSTITNDAFGQPTTVVTDEGVTTNITYNQFGLPETTIVSGSGILTNTSIIEYDLKKRFVTKKTNSLNHAALMTYDAAYGNVLTQTNANGLITTYTYDGFGRISTTTPPAPTPVITTTRAWAVDNTTCQLYVVTSSQSGMPIDKQFYDNESRGIRSETNAFNGTTIFATKRYNSIGQILNESEPNSTTLFTSYEYEPDFKRLKKVTSPNGATVEYSYTGNVTTSTTTAGSSVRTVIKTTDESGALISSTDEGGSINYLYHSSGNPRSITVNGGVPVTMEYDAFGRQTKLTDPNAGLTTYAYDKLGRIIKQQTAKQAVFNSTYSTTITYDELGRVKIKADPQEGTITNAYDPTNGKGMLASITMSNLPATDIINSNYTYDNLSRLITKTDQNVIITGSPSNNYTTVYSYDNLNRVTQETYPGGYIVKSVYNNYGYLDKLTNSDGSLEIWKCNEMNERGQVKKSTFGNGMTTEKFYTSLGYLQQTLVKDPSVTKWDMRYNFDAQTGNLYSRSDYLRSRSETFTYDNLDRLEMGVNQDAYVSTQVAYSGSGNILNKGDAGDYEYAGLKPHAVTAINNPASAIPTLQQDITYTAFNKAKTVIENGNTLTFTYGYDQQRRKSELKNSGGTILREIAYLGNPASPAGRYEKIKQGSTTYEVNYIAGTDGLAAMYVTQNGTGSMYYVNTDHLGSIALVYNQSKVKTTEQSFDAWGRDRDPATWAVRPPLWGGTGVGWLIRGYTGHEHHREFGLINMNGRMYDPLIGRMMSADNYAQAAGFTQSYNRYSYCWNNPLKYTDPDGQFVHIIIGAVVGGIINVALHAGQIHSWTDFGVAFAIGGVAGAVGAATGGAAFLAAGGGAAGAGGFLAGFAGGAVGSAASMPIQNVGNHVYFGDPIMSAKQYAFGILAGGVVGGTINGLNAVYHGRSFGLGNLPGQGPGSTPIPSGISKSIAGDTRESQLRMDKMQPSALPDEQMPNSIPNNTNAEGIKQINAPEGGMTFPGNDPAKVPPGFEWKGQQGSIPGSKNGNWYNPNTGTSLRPDLNHPSPIGPHWDYKNSSGQWFRIFPDGSIVPK